jgi:hypothetical protein
MFLKNDPRIPTNPSLCLALVIKRLLVLRWNKECEGQRKRERDVEKKAEN